MIRRIIISIYCDHPPGRFPIFPCSGGFNPYGPSNHNSHPTPGDFDAGEPQL